MTYMLHSIRLKSSRLLMPSTLALLVGILVTASPVWALDIEQYKEYDLGLSSTYIIDDKDALNIDLIKDHTEGLNWRKPEKGQLNFGFLDKPIWIKNELIIKGSFSEPWLINIDYPLLDHLTLHVYVNNQHVDTVVMGDTLPFANRPLLSKNFLYRVLLNKGDQITLYSRIQSSGNLLVPFKISPVNSYLAEARKSNILTSALYGILLVMALYNLFISLIVRDSNYVIYVGWVFSALIFIFTLNGDAFQILWPNNPIINDYMLPIMWPIAGFLNTLFVLKFLKIEENRKRIAKVFYVVLGLFVLSLLISFFGNYSVSIRFAYLVNSLSLILITFSMLYLVIKRQPGAIIFFLSYSLLILSSIILILGTATVIPKTVFTVYANQIAQALETVIFSLALAQKIETEKRLRKQKEKEAFEFSEQAKENLEQYNALFKHSALGIFRFNKFGEIQVFNPAFFELFKLERDETSALNLVFKDLDHLQNSITNVDSTRSLYVEEIDLSKDTENFWISLTIMPIKDGSLYEGQVKDITKEKLAEIEAEQQEKQKAEMISRLVSGVAHEINTPIGTNITALSLLDEELKSVRALFEQSTMTKDNLAGFFSTCDNVSDIITLNQRRISALVDKFKEVSVNRLSMTKDEFDLVDLIRRVTLGYSTNKCEVIYNLPDTPYFVNSFEQAYTEIIAQLISNSVKFTESEKVKISVSLTFDEEQPRFTYQDDGPGMDPNVKKKHAFEPFYTTRPGDPECTGLGMFAISNLCKQLLHTNPEILDGDGFGLTFLVYTTDSEAQE